MRLFVVIVLMAGAFAMPEHAAAQDQIAVAGPNGFGSSRLRERLESVFRNDADLELVEEDDLREARREAGGGPRALARHLEAWVVGGHTARRNREFQTTLVLYDAAGTTRARVKLSARRLTQIVHQIGNAGRRLWRRGSRNAARAAARAGGGAEEDVDDVDEDVDEDSDEGVDEDDEPEALPAADAEGLDELDEEVEDFEREVASDVGRDIALRTMGRVGFMHRRMSTRAMVSAAARMQPGDSIEEPRNYTSPGIGQGQIGIGFEFYPGALFPEQSNTWLGMRFHLAGSPWLKSMAPACDGFSRCPEEDAVTIDTRQREIYGGLVGRFGFGPHAFSVDLGYGSMRFAFDRMALGQVDPSRVVPSMTHRYVRAGVEGTFALMPRTFEVDVRAAYLIGVGLGDEAKEMWGSDSQSLGGVDLGFSLRTELGGKASGITLELYTDVTLFRTRFRGQTVCPETESDCSSPGSLWEPWPAANGPRGDQVTGGVRDDVRDRYISFGLAFGYTWRGLNGSGGGADDADDDDDDVDVEEDVEEEALEEDLDSGTTDSPGLPPPVYEDEETSSGGSSGSLPPPIY